MSLSARDVPDWPKTLPGNNNNNDSTWPSFSQLNDAAIAWAFTRKWLPWAAGNLNEANGTQLTKPWFCAVSFINPHDITHFPYAFGLTSPANNNFQTRSNSISRFFQPAPANNSQITYYGNNCSGGTNNTQCTADGDLVVVSGYNDSLYTALPYGTGNNGHWNWEDLTQLPYANNGKPRLQQYFLNLLDGLNGAIASPGNYNNSNNNWSDPYAWRTFLNYYFWMQSCVDWQVGEVLGLNPDDETFGAGLKWADGGTFWDNTIIIFTSDHGDYGGSHGLHTKGGGFYEESMNVPFLISYPSMRSGNGGGPYRIPYVCSSVDLLPFLYTLALGNHSWRNNSNDMIYYLRGRETISDAIFTYSNNNTIPVRQRRISSIPLHVPIQTGGCNAANNASCYAWQVYQPFVLHTADDFAIADLGNNSGHNYQAGHAIAFRTTDLTDVNTSAASLVPQNAWGGGKLGIYSYWNTCDDTSAPIMGINSSEAANQYEFYNYSPHPPGTPALTANPREIGNQYFDGSGCYTSEAVLYQDDFFNNNQSCSTYDCPVNIQNELYYLNAGNGGTPTQQVQTAIQVAYAWYRYYLQLTDQITGSDGKPTGNSCS